MDWFDYNQQAQNLALILHEFPQYTFETVGKLGVMQAQFLATSARWYIKHVRAKK